jgi:hypothetical protein
MKASLIHCHDLNRFFHEICQVNDYIWVNAFLKCYGLRNGLVNWYVISVIDEHIYVSSFLPLSWFINGYLLRIGTGIAYSFGPHKFALGFGMGSCGESFYVITFFWWILPWLMFAVIFAYKRCWVLIYCNLFCIGIMCRVCYLHLFTHTGVQHDCHIRWYLYHFTVTRRVPLVKQK